MYLVTGATGSLGRRIVRQLRDSEQLVRAFVRLSSRFGELEDRGADIFIGDLKYERDIVKAVAMSSILLVLMVRVVMLRL